MLNFLVLGLIPGTNIQINFDFVVDLLIAGMVVAISPRLLHNLEARTQKS